MSLNARNIPMAGGGDKNRPDPLDPGTYPARLVQVLLLFILILLIMLL